MGPRFESARGRFKNLSGFVYMSIKWHRLAKQGAVIIWHAMQRSCRALGYDAMETDATEDEAVIQNRASHSITGYGCRFTNEMSEGYWNATHSQNVGYED